MNRPLPIRLADEDAERARQSHHAAITELQTQPSATERIIYGVSLADGVVTPVSHGLGRAPLHYALTQPQFATTAGVIIEIRDSTIDRTKYLGLKASGFGATILVDVSVK